MTKIKVSLWQIVGLSLIMSVMLAPAIAGAETPRYGGVLKIIDMAEGAAPLGSPWETRGIDTKLQKPVLEGLLREDVSGKYYPHLATSYKIDQANNTITLTLQKGVKFHDGTDFNAQAVKWCIEKGIENDIKIIALIFLTNKNKTIIATIPPIKAAFYITYCPGYIFTLIIYYSKFNIFILIINYHF